MSSKFSIGVENRSAESVCLDRHEWKEGIHLPSRLRDLKNIVGSPSGIQDGTSFNSFWSTETDLVHSRLVFLIFFKTRSTA